LRNEEHVRLRCDDRAEPLTEDRMVLNAQDANGFPLQGSLLFLILSPPATLEENVV